MRRSRCSGCGRASNWRACMRQRASSLRPINATSRPSASQSHPRCRHSGWDTLQAVSPVRMGQDRLGTLYIQRELTDLYDRLRVGGMAAGGLVLLAILTAFVIAYRMQRSISSPMLQLAEHGARDLEHPRLRTARRADQPRRGRRRDTRVQRDARPDRGTRRRAVARQRGARSRGRGAAPRRSRNARRRWRASAMPTG